MRYSRPDRGWERVATLDIETTHWKAGEGETVSVGLGVHDRGAPSENATYELFHRDGSGEATLINRALERVDDLDADVLVSYNGRSFDLEFLRDRCAILGETYVPPEIDTRETHIDLFEDRKARCGRTGDKWPKLEECLDSYGIPRARTVWGGREVTNERFGNELGPSYLEALGADDDSRIEALEAVIEHYLVTDLEANLAIYYADLGDDFDPAHLASEGTFE